MKDNETKLFASNFVVEKEMPVIDVIEGPNGTIIEKDTSSDKANKTISSRATSTSSSTSRTSGTRTNSVIEMSSLPDELKGKSAVAPMGDSDNDNTSDSDSDPDAVLDNDLVADDGEATITSYSENINVTPPLAPEGTIGVIKLDK